MTFKKFKKGSLPHMSEIFQNIRPNEAVPRNRLLWNSIASQLAGENKKFIYDLVHKVHRVTKPSLPLKSYKDVKAFKLFILDVGLLSCMTRLTQKTIIDGKDIFIELKAPLPNNMYCTAKNYKNYQHLLLVK